ncbi:MAG TPA: class F sortase, partial [Solirubrobacteraceae bacterium]|nr:class F sortase [Solirubrobacteraceae bacterium]
VASPPVRRARPRPIPDPPRIEIPAIGVRAHVISLGLTRGHRLEVPQDPSQAGWWSGGARPGDPGAAVVVGHVDGTRAPAVFERLGELRAGDLVRYVHADGRVSTFRARSRESHPKDDFPTRRVYGPSAGPALRLVTCTGTFDAGRGHYRDNLIVFATPA